MTDAEKIKDLEQRLFDSNIGYLDLVEMVAYHSPSTHEKIFNTPSHENNRLPAR